MGWLSSAVEQGPATLQCNDLKDAVLHIEEQVISAAHAVVGEELATNSEAEGNQPLQGAGNLERLVWLALHYNSRNRPSSIAAFEDGDTSVKCVCVCVCVVLVAFCKRAPWAKSRSFSCNASVGFCQHSTLAKKTKRTKRYDTRLQKKDVNISFIIDWT